MRERKEQEEKEEGKNVYLNGTIWEVREKDCEARKTFLSVAKLLFGRSFEYINIAFDISISGL